MTNSSFEFTVSLEELIVHRTRSKDADSIWLHMEVCLLDLTPGLSNDNRLLSTWTAEGQVSSDTRSGDRVFMARRSGMDQPTNAFLSPPFEIAPLTGLSVSYWAVNLSNENHDPAAQKKKFDDTVAAFQAGVSIAGGITTVALIPFGLVPGAAAGAVTGGLSIGLAAVKALYDFFESGPAVNCDGLIFHDGLWFRTYEQLLADTATENGRVRVTTRFADLEQSPMACGAAPDIEVALQGVNLGPTSFDPALSGDRTLVPYAGAHDLDWSGTWGDVEDLAACRIICQIGPAGADQKGNTTAGLLESENHVGLGTSGALASTVPLNLDQNVGVGISPVEPHSLGHSTPLDKQSLSTSAFANVAGTNWHKVDLIERSSSDGPVILNLHLPKAQLRRVLTSGDNPLLHRHDPNDPPVNRIDLDGAAELDEYGVMLSDGKLESIQLRFRRFGAEENQVLEEAMLVPAYRMPT